MTFDSTKYEEEKRERRRLRGRQRSLTIRFLNKSGSLTEFDWEAFSASFSEALLQDKELDPTWIDPERYLIAIFNIFSSLGFNVHFGPIPRLSDVQAEYRHPIFVYDNQRALLIENRPTYLFADLADIQPLCPLPIIGLSYNSIISTKIGPEQRGYAAQSLQESKRIAGALALAHITLGFGDLAEAIRINPFKDKNAVLPLVKRIGLLDLLRPPIDAIPVFGQQTSANYDLKYNIDQFLKDTQKTSQTGSDITLGDVTQAKPAEALSDPEYYFKELQQTKLISINSKGDFSGTHNGWAYLRSRVLPFPLGQLLYHICQAAREEVRNATKEAFVHALQIGNTQFSYQALPLFVGIEEIDSFAKIALVPPNLMLAKLPLKEPEAEIKKVILSAIGEPFEKADWGGEQNDILTTRVLLRGKRVPAAFFLKGPSVSGRLTIAKCGKSGDQIQRLFQSPADVFIVQYNGEIDERVLEECRQKITLLRSKGRHNAFFTIIDGLDTARLLAAYRDGFTS
jgi:hypothetical protein